MATCDTEIVQSEIGVYQEAVALIDDTIDASVVTVDPIIQVSSEEYVLSSGGMYGGSAMVGAVPDWILNAVQQQLTTGDGNLTSVVNDIQTLLSSLQTGVSQVVQSLNTLSTSTSSITTALQSQVDQNHSEVMNVVATKVDAAQAQAVALSAINSTFGSDVNAYIGNIASTYVDENSAIGQEVNMLTATIGDVSASISDVSSVTVEEVLNPLWIDDGIQTDPDINGEPRYVLQAKAKKQLSVDANGIVTGLILESGATSEFTVQADEFKLVASGQNVASRNPFTVDATTGNITFNGSVSFNSVTGTPPLVAENTNINVTNNLVPNNGWYAEGHADYLFVGTPSYLKMIGAGAFQEDTLLLNVGDEVYTPYIADLTKSYKIGYAFKGSMIGSLVQIDGTTSTLENVVPSATIDPIKWYIVQAIVLPSGSTAGSLFGKIQEADTLNVVATFDDKVLGVATDWFALGFVATADTYISRVVIEEVNTDTLNAIPVTSSNLTTALAATSTVIDGARITTGYISADRIEANSITANKISTLTALVGHTLQSSDFTSIGGTGFRLKSNAAGTFEDPTIYGAYIRGGTIDSSTMNVRLLNVVNDYGYTVNPILNKMSTRVSNFVINLNIYTAQSTEVTKDKLASQSSTKIIFDVMGYANHWSSDSSLTSGADYDYVRTFNGIDYLIIASVNTPSSNSRIVDLYVGNSLIGSFTGVFKYNSPTYFTIGGIGFATMNQNNDGEISMIYEYILMIRRENVVNINAGGNISIRGRASNVLSFVPYISSLVSNI